MDEFYMRMMNFTEEDMRSLKKKPEIEEKEVCPYFLEGKCRYGDSCWMFHPSEGVMEVCGDRDCGVCLLKIRGNNREFGLLMGCAHCFCLNCLRTWRGQLNVPKEIARSCPICRTPSFYIIPSATFVEDYQEKVKLAEEYRKKLMEVPCKYFDYGDGNCPFGSSCFYDHRYKNGNKWVPPPPLFEANEVGEWGVVRKPKLSDMLDF